MEFNETLNEKFLSNIEQNYEHALETLYKKNADYAEENDPFLNFREAAAFAGITVRQGILVRLGDKLTRYKNLTKPGRIPEVVEETKSDTLEDAINYLNILKTWDDLGEPDADTSISSSNFSTAGSNTMDVAESEQIEESTTDRRGWLIDWLSKTQK